MHLNKEIAWQNASNGEVCLCSTKTALPWAIIKIKSQQFCNLHMSNIRSSYLSLCSCTFPIGDSRSKAQTLRASASYRNKTLYALSEITQQNENTRCVLMLPCMYDENVSRNLVGKLSRGG